MFSRVNPVADRQGENLLLGLFEEYLSTTTFRRMLDGVASALLNSNGAALAPTLSKTAHGSSGNSLAITSLLPHEGKTFFCASLAYGLGVFLKKRVLVIDASCEHSDQSLLTSGLLGAAYGSCLLKTKLNIDIMNISEIIRERDDKIVYPANTKAITHNLDFQISTLLTALKASYDVILLDCGCLTSHSKDLPDPMLVAKQCSSSIFVTSNFSKNHPELEQSLINLTKTGAKIMGTIFNPGAAKPKVTK